MAAAMGTCLRRHITGLAARALVPRQARRGDQSETWQLVQDMRLAIGRSPDTGEFSHCSAKELRGFAQRASAVLHMTSFDEGVSIFYWLTKCAQGSGYELEERMLLGFAAHIRREGLAGSEASLARILRSLTSVLNRNKIQRALETDAQLKMEQLTHELLASAMPRLCSRHQHLPLVDISVVLSAYAKMFRPQYADLFKSLVPNLMVRLQRSAHSELLRMDMQLHAPFLLVAYAQARCVHISLFDTFLDWLEEGLPELGYESLAVIAYAVAHAGINRASLWKAFTLEITTSGSQWSLRAIGRMIGASRKLLMHGLDPSKKYDDDSFVALFRAARTEMLRQKSAMTFHEATDVLLALAMLPSSFISESDSIQIMQLACSHILAASAEFPPSYLASSCYALVALHLESPAPEVGVALRALTRELRTKMCLCLVLEMELVAQALLALAVNASAELAQEFCLGSLFLVQQREAVRKAHDFGPSAAARLVAFTMAGCYELETKTGSCILQKWFFPDMLSYVQSASNIHSRPDCDATEHVTWLRQVDPDRMTLKAWTPGVLWYFRPGPGESAAAKAYGGKDKLMGWSKGQLDAPEEDNSNMPALGVEGSCHF
eukprot:TRINITY_DN28778_c0_g2_i1.p1 TRINITY_DN28778_c0_g2~~TRINITY_DN28778_c0_g2_i1.p1  ORF type:complete len:606 (+),score=100.38 TRINITY_DN28778_c0_g2_i1:244-2061(+)